MRSGPNLEIPICWCRASFSEAPPFHPQHLHYTPSVSASEGEEVGGDRAYDDLAGRGIVPVIGHHQAHILKMWMCNNQDNGPKTCNEGWKMIIAMEWAG